MPGALTRRAEFGGGVDLAARSVPIVVATEAPVMRDGYAEVLRMSAVDLARAPLPLIESHDATRVNIGIVDQLRVDGDTLRGIAIFGMSSRASELLADVQAGIVRGVSVGYRHADDGREITLPDGRRAVAFAWQPHEASVVAIPADVRAGFYRSTGDHMNTATAAPDAAEVRNLCRGLPDGFADALITTGASLDAARAAVTAELARRDAAAGGHRNVTPADYFARRSSEPELARAQMADALAARMGATGIDTSANQYRGARIVDMARDHLELRNVRTSAMSASDIIKRALHGTGDFAALLTESGNRVLAAQFGAYQGGLRRAAKQTTIRDFRAKSVIKLGEAPSLQLVNEHGEFKYGTMATATEGYSLKTYGRIFGVTRQALVNDDLSAFDGVIRRFAEAAFQLENGELVTLLTQSSGAGPTMSDGAALFHADHGNLATGGGSALSETSLAAARAAMRLQKGLDGSTPIDATPRFLIVPAALENTALQLTTETTPATSGNVNPTGRNLEVVVDPRLDAVSATAWYLAADPDRMPTLEYAYLETDTGPRIEADFGFDIDGVSYKCRLDFGCGVLDHRGLYRAAGA
jgi:phage head maturation protease